MNTTPMMRQYHEAKQSCPDALLLFRMGDFYELFHDDAKTAARILGLTLTSRDKGENPVPMAGFPYHQLDGYLAKLISHGQRVAVCEQMEDPSQAKGLVKREVTRVVTAGTLTDDGLLEPGQSNLLLAVCGGKLGSSGRRGAESERVGLAWVDVSTGRFEAGVFPDKQLLDWLVRLEPAEVLLRDDDARLDAQDRSGGWSYTLRPAWQFGQDEAERVLRDHFQVADLAGMGWEEEEALAVRAAGAALAYLQETQKSSLSHIRLLLPIRSGTALEIDAATRRSLELTTTLRSGRSEGTLLSVLDQTLTPMGARCLASWLAAPLVEVHKIQDRLGGVEQLVERPAVRQHLRQALGDVYDLQRLLARVCTGRTNPRDLQQVARTLSQLPKIKQTLQEANLTGWLASLIDKLEPCQELRVQLEQALDDHCPLVYREGGFIRPGYHSALDELRGLAAGGKQWMANYQAEQIEATGISSLKVGYNKVFGYYLEVTHTHRQRVPDYFVRKQTLKNAERYITEELKEYEERVLTADDRARELEIELFMRLREAVDAHRQPLADAAERLAQLDCLAGLAELAVRQGYVRPTLTEEPVLEIKEGRHPVLDAQLAPGSFVPNDVLVGQQHGRVLLITGPNMAGKSTYIRQTALLVIMAQMGSFIPAASATIGVADRVFARVGASDELARGQSTFMVEMVETARILNTATERSLVILDEIGRGTSTYDGLSLAWAIVEHLHDHLQPRTLFATHYHELTELGRRLTGVQNWNVAVKEWQDSIVFLHRIVPGGADRSYGIHVARLAGVPDSVNQRAGQILENLERQRSGTEPPAVPAPTHRPIQMKLFELVPAHPLLDQLRQLDIDRLSPIEALSQLKSWQQELHAAQSAEPTVAGAHHLKSSR